MIDCFFIREEERLKNRKREVGEMVGREAFKNHSVTNCNRFGNAAKMREALRGLLEIVCIDCNSSYKVDGKCVKCPRVVAAESALSAPPRNCDLYSHDEAFRIWRSLPESKENGYFDEWLYAEAKGYAK